MIELILGLKSLVKGGRYHTEENFVFRSCIISVIFKC